MVMGSKTWSMSEESDIESNVDPESPITEPQTPLASGRKILPCPYRGCTKSFNRQARLTEHIRSHTNERPFKCLEHECGKAFLRDSHLKHHMKSAHTNERNYPCTWPSCDKKFSTGTRLRRHESGHATKEKHTCKGFGGCNESFRKHATLARHILSVHEHKKPFPCTEIDAGNGEQCTWGFDTAERLRSHKRAVHDQTRFMCLDCSPVHDELDSQVSFATFALLQNHIALVHPPTCPQCHIICASEKDLRRHLELEHNTVVSQAEKGRSPNFLCTYPSCTRSFTKKGNLNVHVKTVHEHRRDFVCGETELKLPCQILPAETSEITGCGRHFTSKATLEEHVRTVHLGMHSKRQARNRKRKAERGPDFANADADSCARTKRRENRAAKSVIAELTGSANMAVATAYEAGSGLNNPFDAAAYHFHYGQNSHQDFDAQPFPRQDDDSFLGHDEGKEESCVGSSFVVDIDLNRLAVSALVDPALLPS